MGVRQFWWLPLIFTACAAQVAIQIAWVRIFSKRGLYPSIVAGFAGGLLAWTLFTCYFLSYPFGEHLANLGIYICFSYTFFHWNNMGETARRVRIAIEMYGHDSGLTREELLTRYCSREIIVRRVDRLVKSGQIEQKGTRLYSRNRSVFFMSKLILLLKWLLQTKIVVGN